MRSARGDALRRELIALITEPLVVRRILRHLELPSEPPPPTG
jgi:hypothetical protein